MGKRKKFWNFSSSKSVYGGSFDPYGDDDDFSTSSSTGWEKSHYGGFERPVWDYPSVSLSNDVEIVPGELKGKWLGEYFREKVVKIFLSKVKNNALMDRLWIGAKVEKIQTGFFHKKTVLAYTVEKHQIQIVLDSIIKHEAELSALFNYYVKVIEDSLIRIIVPEEPKCEHGEGGSPPPPGEGDPEKGEGEGEGDAEPEEDTEVKEIVSAAMIESYRAGKTPPGKMRALRSAIAPLLEKMFEDKTLTLAEKTTVEKYMAAVAKNHMKGLKEIEFSTSSKLSSCDLKPVAVIEKENLRETVYTPNEITASESLVKLLDISFESKSDEIKNLRLGKMDLSKLAEVPAGNFHIYQQTVEDQDTRPFSVVMLGDESGSMGCNGRLKSQYSLMKTLYRSFCAIMPADKIWAYGHAGDMTPELFVYHEPETPNFLTTIDNMLRHHHAQNYDGPIVEFIHQRVRAKTSDRIIFVVLSDGTPGGHGYGSAEDHVNYKQILEKCKRDDFIVCGVMIQIDNGRHLYNYSTRVDSMKDMPKKVSNLLNKVVKTEFQ